MRKLKIMLVDDSIDFINITKRFLISNNFNISAVAEDGETALEKLDSIKPDLVLMDISMPGLNGFEVTRKIKSKDFPPKVIILSLNESTEYREEAIKCGADGFCSKSHFTSSLVPLINRMFSLHSTNA